MAELKTKKDFIPVKDALDSIPDEQKKEDCQKLLKIFSEATSEKPAVWGNGVFGFGTYNYKSERSSQAGEWFRTGFAPRKQNITIYIIPGLKNYPKILEQLGKHKISGVSCLAIKKLSDINTEILKKLIIASLKDTRTMYPN